MRRSLRYVVKAFFLLAALSPVARADRDEWRVGVSTAGGIASMAESASSATPLSAGLAVHAAHGLTNSLEVGARAAWTWMPLVELLEATVDGDDGDLYAELFVPSLAVEARWQGGVELHRAFWRTHPVVGIRGGLMGLWMRDRLVIDPPSGLLVGRYDDDFAVRPLVGLDAGVEHRFGKGFVAALGLSFDAVAGYRSLSLALDLSWLFY